jgi:CheY-like chemotaxis protein
MQGEPDARALLLEGIAAARRGDRETARRRLRQAVERKPETATAWHWLAAVAASREEARRCLERCLDLQPENERVRRDLARLVAAPGPARIPARPPAPAALPCPFCGDRLQPRSPRCPSCRALLSLASFGPRTADPDLDRARLRQALDHHAESVRQRPSAALHLILALGHLNLGDLDRAILHLERFVAARPEATGKREQLERLRRLRGERRVRGYVLVVARSPVLAGLLRRILEARGHAVRIAGDAREARRLASESRPDLVLLDAGQGDGSAACRGIRSNRASRDVPIFLLTGSGAQPDAVFVRRVGAAGFLPMPCDPRELVALAERFGGARQSGQLDATSPPSISKTLPVTQLDAGDAR